MSMFKCVFRNMTGSTQYLIVSDMHIGNLRPYLATFAANEFTGDTSIDVEFLNHGTEFWVSELNGYDKIKVLDADNVVL